MDSKVVNMRMNNFENYKEQMLEESIRNNAKRIAKSLMRQKDVEIRKTANGISISEISKRVVVR